MNPPPLQLLSKGLHPTSAPSVATNTEHRCSQNWLTVLLGATSETCGARVGLIGPHTRTNGCKRPTTKNYGSVSGCSYHYPSSTPYPLRNDTNCERRWACSSFA